MHGRATSKLGSIFETPTCSGVGLQVIQRVGAMSVIRGSGPSHMHATNSMDLLAVGVLAIIQELLPGVW